MSWCEACNKGVDYCDCIPQKYRERIAKEIEMAAWAAMKSNEYNFNDTAVQAKTFMIAADIARGNK